MTDPSSADRPTHEIWVVDRVEEGIAVLVEDEGEIVVELAASELGDHAVEGAVLLVPLGSVGEPVWSHAERSESDEAARTDAGEQRLRRLRERDPGGDVEL